MDNMINFGIDLGTTNSLIARFVKGNVEVFKNPVGFKETLPSVVAFRRDRILFGDQARVYLERDSKSVVGGFKRKMGTTEMFKIRSLDQAKSPTELSAYILKELKTFVRPVENIDAVVITVPASFDIIQSNATKEAGVQAGFKQVVLLQEPIAASLAYANKQKSKDLSEAQWIVYDLGGGTFDVALVRIHQGEMKVVDHEGDNFLGGSDFDRLIVENIVIPYLEKNGAFRDLSTQMKSAEGKYNTEWYGALLKAEEAKKELSTRPSSEIEMSITDENGEQVDVVIPITRSDFESLIREHIDRTAHMIKTIMTRASLQPQDVQFVLLVGGSTYIPYVQKRIEELLQISVNCDIDPTSAIAIGAAYFAGTKEKQVGELESEKRSSALKIKMTYQPTSLDDEEFFAARVEGKLVGMFYRIIREDGGFDTGLKPLAKRINEDLPLVKDSYNSFTLTIYDSKNSKIEVQTFGISHGILPPVGQPLAHDICLEIDDIESEEPGATKLLPVFQKNSVLPLSRQLQRTITKTIIKGSADNVLRINILEGPSSALPLANQKIGQMTISGRDLMRDVVKGSDIDITLEVTESRDLKVSAYLTMTNQTFVGVFKPNARTVEVEKLLEEVESLATKNDKEMGEAIGREDYEVAKELDKHKRALQALLEDVQRVPTSDVTDARYQLDDKKRKIAQEIDSATRGKHLSSLRSAYVQEKNDCEKVVLQNGNDYERKLLNDIISQETVFLSSNSSVKIQERISELRRLQFSILWRTPEFLVNGFRWFSEQRGRLNQQQQAKSLLEAGQVALDNQNYDRLGEIVRDLYTLLPNDEQNEMKRVIGIR